MRLEATLGQAALQRHLTAFVAARTRLLALVTTAGSLAQTGTDTTANAALGMLGTCCRLDAIEFHHQSFQRTFTK